ncbi:tetratricopeptide repeat protein [Alienimonas chondri]|uniref:Tetratricopeptide repeat protein n=1 Tax=Alienimonas chondri TaxID=2681879 RepID=A0ABX1VJ06_9PLAN|nr:tetratricopeptide repeat protein [Alienimonas chondri]NNJ28122.1 hypothetical protein [Alienimonas chondri]
MRAARSTPLPLVLPLALAALAWGTAESIAAPPPPAMLTYLEKKATASPEDANAQRLYGRALVDAERADEALEPLRAAVELEPLGGAARFDLGRALHAAGDLVGAAEQWREAVRIAPDSEYAADAQARLAELPPEFTQPRPDPWNDPPDAAHGAASPGVGNALAEDFFGDGPGNGLGDGFGSDADESDVALAGYEIRQFPGPPAPAPFADEPIAESFFPSLLPDDLPLYLRLETGLLYDSNVALAPTSRQLAPGDRESAQFFVAPEMEWAALKGDGWAAGPLFYSRFTLNEEPFEALNLSSYTPGLYYEQAVPWEGGVLVPRLEYRFTLDQFDGETFSERHGLTGRLTHLGADGVATVGYLSIDHADFRDDGILPEVTSADGVTYATGLAREWAPGLRHLSSVRVGVDLDRLDATGSDYAYLGAGLSGQAVIPIVESLNLTLDAGVGFRHYDQFEFEPSRDEVIYRAGGELRKWFTPRLSVAAVANYQAFDSENPLFQSDRFVTGVVTEWVY